MADLGTCRHQDKECECLIMAGEMFVGLTIPRGEACVPQDGQEGDGGPQHGRGGTCSPQYGMGVLWNLVKVRHTFILLLSKFVKTVVLLHMLLNLKYLKGAT